jgi:hypothetical protein
VIGQGGGNGGKVVSLMAGQVSDSQLPYLEKAL